MILRTIYRYSLAIIFILPGALFAQDLVIEAGIDSLPISSRIEIFHDPTGTLDWDAVRDGDLEFKRSPGENPNLGQLSGALWARVQITNRGPRTDWLLLLENTNMDRFELFAWDSLEKRAAGRILPFAGRYRKSRNPVLPLSLPTDLTRTVWMRFESRTPLLLPLHLVAPGEFQARDHDTQLLVGLFNGGLAIMAIYNLFIFVSLRDATYLIYVVYIFFAGLSQFSLLGLNQEYILPGGRGIPGLGLFFAGGMWIFLSWFSLRFLADPGKKKTARGRRYAMIAACVLPGLLLMIGSPFLNGRQLTVLAVATSLIVVCFLFFYGLFRWWKGFKPARIYLVGWAAFFAGIIVLVLKSQRILPHNLWTHHGIQLGLSVQVIALSFALADRINTLREDAAKIRDDLSSLGKASERFVPHFTGFLNFDIRKIYLGQSLDLNLTVLFSDIRDFTALSSTMSSEELVRFLNGYYARLNPIIEEFGGFIDKHIGDSILAIFPENPDSALNAAINATYELNTLNEQRLQEGLQPIKTCFGIHTGPVTLGTVGTENRMEATVIGDTVNIASRTEQLTKVFHSTILVTDQARKFLHRRDEFSLREVAYMRVRGKDNHIAIYECFETDPIPLKDEKERAHGNLLLGLSHMYARDFDAALRQFEEASRLCPADPVPVFNLQRCRLLRESEDESQNPRVLLIDDNPAILDLLGNKLKKRHIRFERAADSGEAFRILSQREFDVIVIDVQLDEVDGIELLHQFKQDPRHRAARFLVLSADEDPGTAERASAAGVAFFLKPQDFDALIIRVEETLQLFELFDRTARKEIGRGAEVS